MMGYTKRQIVMAGLCAIGTAVFAYDRLQPKPSLTEPETASAIVVSPQRPARPASPAVLQTAMVADPVGQINKRIADRLTAIANDNPMADDARDAFRAPASWLPSASEPAPSGKESDQAKTETFRQRHALQAVMVSPNGRQVVINGKCLTIGQKIDDFELVSVGEQSAILVSSTGVRVTVELPAGANMRSE